MTAAVFDRIYRHNLWHGDESRSGPGSGPTATRPIIAALLGIVDELGIDSVLDVGCGDGYWMPDLPGYVGFDWSTVALQLARDRHPERDYTGTWPERQFDLIVCRDVMQHLPLDAGMDLLARIRRSGRWALLSTYVGGTNVDIDAGDAYCPDLQAPPFDMPVAERLVFDGYHYHPTDQLRDGRKHLALWKL